MISLWASVILAASSYFAVEPDYGVYFQERQTGRGHGCYSWVTRAAKVSKQHRRSKCSPSGLPLVCHVTLAKSRYPGFPSHQQIKPSRKQRFFPTQVLSSPQRVHWLGSSCPQVYTSHHHQCLSPWDWSALSSGLTCDTIKMHTLFLAYLGLDPLSVKSQIQINLIHTFL